MTDGRLMGGKREREKEWESGRKREEKKEGKGKKVSAGTIWKWNQDP